MVESSDDGSRTYPDGKIYARARERTVSSFIHRPRWQDTFISTDRPLPFRDRFVNVASCVFTWPALQPVNLLQRRC